MKKTYVAPYAEIVMFAPVEPIAQWSNDNENWKTDGFFWSGVTGATNSTPASGTTYWWDFGTAEIDPD